MGHPEKQKQEREERSLAPLGMTTLEELRRLAFARSATAGKDEGEVKRPTLRKEREGWGTRKSKGEKEKRGPSARDDNVRSVAATRLRARRFGGQRQRQLQRQSRSLVGHRTASLPSCVRAGGMTACARIRQGGANSCFIEVISRNCPDRFKAYGVRWLRSGDAREINLLSFACRYSIDNRNACAQCDCGPGILQFT